MTTPTTTMFGITYDEAVAFRHYLAEYVTPHLESPWEVLEALPETTAAAHTAVAWTWPDRDITTWAEHDAWQRELWPHDEEDE